MGLQAAPGRAQQVQHPRKLAGLAQSGPAYASGGRQSRAICRGVQLHLALGQRHRLPDCGDSVVHGGGPVARSIRDRAAPHREATGAGRTPPGRRTGPRLPDELLRSHRHTRSRLRGDGSAIPLLQRAARVAAGGAAAAAHPLFAPLQVVTPQKLGQNPVLMAAANSAGGVMGKMISLTSIAVAAAATSLKREDEARLFRFTLKHSIFLASVIGLLVMFYAYVAPGWAP